MKQLTLLPLLACLAAAHADPRLTLWMTANSTKYARVTETTTTSPVAVWPSPGIPKNAMSPTQAVPAYADVQQILYSSNFVYVRSADLASHRMGPWYKEYAKITVNGLWPDNGRLTSKIPRNPVAVSNPIVVSQQVAQGPVGVLVNGVTIANLGDGSGYDTALARDAGITGGGVPGNQSDVWIRCATGAEGPSLRNIARTAPYMHDGRFATIEEVVAHYSTGIHRSPTLDPNLAKHPEGGLQLSAADQRALVAFLKTLTDN